MDLNAAYPALSRLAIANRKTLADIADTANHHDNYITFRDCLKFALNDFPGWSVDFYHYLSTLNEFISILPSDTKVQRKEWNRINRTNESAFLDVVAEAAWTIHFHDKSLAYSRDVEFNASQPNSGDADFRLNLGSLDLWLDVVNIELAPLKSNSGPRSNSFNIAVAQERLLSKLAERAVKKYNKKFKPHIMSGSIQNASVGILMCIVKSEQHVILPFAYEFEHNMYVPPPNNIFSDQHPGLDVIWVHRLSPRNSQGYLVPRPLFCWLKPTPQLQRDMP
jgi:hypothetical protein